jgi:hypothetical protein
MWIHYAYPPYVAVLYAPFSYLSFKTAYVLHTVLMGVSVFGALSLLRAHVPALRMFFGPAVAASLTFYPLYKAVVGGQNTSLSLLCGAGAAASIASGRFFAAGLWLGLWAFKPQLALPAAFLTALAYPKVIPGLAVALTLLYGLGTLVGGWRWPVWWWQEGVVPFATEGLIVDRGNGISFREVASDLGLPIGWALAALTIVAAAVLSRRPGRQPLPVMALAISTAILISPHALYYDAGLAVLGGVVAGATGSPALVVTGWLVGATQGLRSLFPVPPAMVVVVMMLIVACRSMVSPMPELQSDRPQG